VECPDDNALNDFIAGALESQEAIEIEVHIDGCATCRAILVEVARATEPHPDAPKGQTGPLSIGSLGERYVPEEVLGVGGMSIVYRGRDCVLDRPVALKFMLDAPEDVRARLRREARALAMLSHPNIVDVYDLDISEGSTFLACELVPGGSLVAWMEEASRTPSEILDVVIDAARGLEAAHRVGLVHRDVSPNNILVGSDGRGRVADFGLARLPEGSDSVANEGASVAGSQSHPSRETTGVVGTPAYVAPEVLAGQRALASADQYSLSVVAHEALGNGKLCSAKVARVVGRGMNPDPDHRYASITAFRRALQAATRPRQRLGYLAAAAATVCVTGVVLAAPAAERECAGTNLGLSTELVVDISALHPNVGTAVTDFTTAWAEVRARTCTSAEEHDVGEAALDRRWACLRDRERDIVATATSMASQPNGPATLTTQFQAIEALTPPVQCENDLRLELRAGPPPAALAAEVEALDTAGRWIRAGSYWSNDKTDEEISKAIESATALGYAPLTARLLMYRGQFERDRNELVRARETLESAALMATAHKEDVVAAICWLHIISMEGYANQNFEEAVSLVPLADARIERLGRPADLMSMRERTLALVYDAAARYEEAERHHIEGLQWTEEAYGRVTTVYANTLANMGAHYSRRLNPKLAQERTEEALEITRSRLGPDSLNEAVLLRNLAVNATVQSQADRAARLANTSLAIMSKLLSPKDSRVAPFLTAAGEANLAVGQTDLALEQLGRALTVSEAGLPAAHPMLVDTRRIVGEAYTEVGRLDEADAVLGRAMVELDTHRPHVRAQLLFDLGTLRLAQHRYADAATACERARVGAARVPAEDLVAESVRCRDQAERLDGDESGSRE